MNCIIFKCLQAGCGTSSILDNDETLWIIIRCEKQILKNQLLTRKLKPYTILRIV